MFVNHNLRSLQETIKVKAVDFKQLGNTQKPRLARTMTLTFT